MMKKNQRNILKAVVIIALTLAMIMPASALLADSRTANSKLGLSSPIQTQQIPKLKTLGPSDDVLSEGFETSWVADSNGDLAPPTWEVHKTCTSGTDPFQGYWHQVGTIPFTDPGPVPPHSGSYQAFVHWSYDHQDEWLVTPQLSLGSNSNLEFWFYGHYGSTYLDHYYVKLSPSGGYNPSDFTVILWDATEQPAGDNYYNTPVEVDLSAYDGQNIRLAWNFVDGDGAGLWYATVIDDVLVTSGGGDNIPPVTTCNITGTNPVIITLSATDDGSGVNFTKYKIDADAFASYTGPVEVTEVGDHVVYFYSVDMAGNIETTKNASFTVEAPPINITIKGGMGVSLIIKNVGSSPVVNVNWNISLAGGFSLRDKELSGTILQIPANGTVTKKLPVLGFGKTNITVVVNGVETTKSGFIFLFFVLGVK